MELIPALLVGVSTNLDNLFLGFSLGMAGRRIPAGANWLIGLFSAAAACLFCCLSELCAPLGPVAKLAGAVLLIGLGVYTFLPAKDEGEGQDCRSWRDAVLLGAALAVNCIPVAFGAGLTGVPPLAAAGSVGLLSVAAIRLGNYLGLRAAAKAPRPAVLRRLGGVMMAALGVLQLFT